MYQYNFPISTKEDLIRLAIVLLFSQYLLWTVMFFRNGFESKADKILNLIPFYTYFKIIIKTGL